MRTYEEILQECLDRIPDMYDKREGSVIWEAIAPTCFELAQYEAMKDIDWLETFLGTCTGETLDKRAADYGYSREFNTPATVEATLVGDAVPIGTRFAAADHDIYYHVKSNDGNNVYTLLQDATENEEDETNPYISQTDYYTQEVNYYTGEILPLDNINNLQSASITEVTIPQNPTETDEEFRARVQAGLMAEASDGNVAQYEKWAAEYDGIGKYKITPMWNGVNTVKVSILNELQQPASQTLVNGFQEYLDPDSEGLGNGVAPIGAVVTVDTATAKEINITAIVTYKTGYSSAPNLEGEIVTFFKEIAYDKQTVPILQLGAVFYNDEAIDSVEELLMNGTNADVALTATEVPTLGVLTVGTE